MSKLRTQSQNLNPKSNLRNRTYKFSIEIIRFVNTLPRKQMFWVITDQLLRAATSIGANVIEAKTASSKKDFIKFYTIALKSANETKYWLSLLRDSQLVKGEIVEKLIQESTEIANMLGSSLLTLKGKKF